MTKRTTPLLAFAEYVFPDSKLSEQVWRARLQMIDTAKQVYPKFLDALLRHVFPLYEQCARDGFNFESILWLGSPFHRLHEQDCFKLKTALRKWAAEFNADADWVLDEALQSLRDWYVSSEWRQELRWHQMHPSETLVQGDTFAFRFVGWEPQAQAWSYYKQKAREQFEKQLSAYEMKTRQAAESHGLIRTRRTYEPENMEWFVLYQFAGWTSTKIAGRARPAKSESTILKGIKAARALIDWESLRAPHPKGSRKVR
jgi:hypothetical protein